jgi:PST family polysaccharide transporter
VLTAYAVGLPYGAGGVALAYSIAMGIWLVPHIVWCLHGTVISPADLFKAIARPSLSCLLGGIAVFALKNQMNATMDVFVRLILGATVLAAVYLFMLLFVMGQLRFYLELVRGLRRSST